MSVLNYTKKIPVSETFLKLEEMSDFLGESLRKLKLLRVKLVY